MRYATIISNFTSYGKENLGFYENVDKIMMWRKKYKLSQFAEELMDCLNHSGEARTHSPADAFLAAYVLCKEGYNVQVDAE